MYLLLITYLTIAIDHSSSMILHGTEGGEQRLTFPFPCDSTEITLRHGYEQPFYRSTHDQESISSRHTITIKNETESGNCLLQLTLHNIMIDDQGTYILTAYKNGDMLPDYPRIGLRVGYPPGKVSCEPRNTYFRRWTRLHCTASEGSVPGHIVCFQSGVRIPPLNEPKSNAGKILSQIILARIDADPIYCCSSSIEQAKHCYECKDWTSHPMDIFINVSDPCPHSSHSKDPTPSDHHVEDITRVPSSPNSSKLDQTPVDPTKSFINQSFFLYVCNYVFHNLFTDSLVSLLHCLDLCLVSL